MAWNIDYEHDSEEVVILKRHIAEQDNRYSTLQSQLIKTKDALEDNKVTLDETTCKLRLEADRALRLDEQLRECKERLDKENFMRQNADLAIQSALEKGKQEEATRRELQQALESVSSRETSSNAAISNLRNEKAALERRTWELEANLQQVISAATPKRRGHARSSSFSDVRITTLERDLGESQASVTELQAELAKAQEKLRRTEEDLFRVENERTVLERRTGGEMKNMQEMLASKDEEITRLLGGVDVGLAQEREEELIRRVEEEEAKVLALERLLSESRDLKTMESALQKAEKRLAAEISKAKGLEEKNAGLNRDVKRVRDALEESRTHAQNLDSALDDRASLVRSSQAQERVLRAQVDAQQEEIRSLRATESIGSTSSAQSEHGWVGVGTGVGPVEKLLAAVDRLRNERDELHRQLEFLQVESMFTIKALEDKINPGVATTTVATAAEDPRISQLQSEVQDLLGRLAKTSSRLHIDSSSSATESSRLALIASASLVMVGHLQTRVDHDTVLKDQARVEISGLHSRLQDTVGSHDESLRTAHGLQQSLHDAQQQRNDLLLQVEHLQSQVAANGRIREQYRELQSNLEGTIARLSDVTKALENAESERNSLKVELVNLQRDMALAQEELKQAEQRYSDLQNQQLSSMSSTQVNRKLREQIEELDGRVARRTEQIGIHQHDIKRLETNLKLQEDRIGEMTGELEVAMSEKESMVEDCADAREARDRALKKADDLEDAVAALETQLQALEEQREIEVATLVKVWSSTLVQSRSSTTRLHAAAYQATAAKADIAQRLQLVSAEHNSAVELLHKQASHLGLAQSVATAHREEARDAVVALAVVQTANVESRRTMRYDRDRICALLSATRDELNTRCEEISSLQDQLQRMRAQGLAESTEQQSTHSTEVKKLREANTNLDRLRAELEDELEQMRKGLCVTVEQRDQLRADNDAISAQITQLQSDHAEQLESLRGKLQQVAVDLQEAREAHAAAESACSELSAAKADLENRLDYISQQQDTDSELVAELQSREADHNKRLLDVQNRLDKAMEELQETADEREELEIALEQTKTELSKAKDVMEDHVSQLVQERDALQESLDQVESRHATEVDQAQGRLRDLQAEAKSLRAQLDKAIADHKRIRAAFEAELRESIERYEASNAQRDDVKVQLSTFEAEYDDMEARLQAALEEKDALEAKNTNLESEIQRAFSMQRYLESQLKDSAHEAAAVKTELEQVRENFAHAERDGKAAEMQLTFQATQHEQAIVSLKREIQLLRATPGQDEIVQELEEKIGYMDELMRSKTQEIEENDDRFIELHKEKKKLTAKVETLTRKVQTLQTKLAALRDATLNQNPPQPIASTAKHSPPIKEPVAAAPVQYTKLSLPVSSVTPGSPPRSRARSGPSAPLGPKTPDRGPTPSVFRAKTPEPAKASSSRLQDPLPTAIVVGRKRAAPDDGDETETVPVQGFTSEGVLAAERNVATPRRRKSPRTGFTPVRNTTTRPLTTLSTESAAQAAAPPIISDVTNSPRGQPHEAKAKRSWLGTHKSRSTQSSNNGTERTASARPGAAERVR